nr:carbon catabolite repressor protein 4 homolog 3 [Ipomoea trifida]
MGCCRAPSLWLCPTRPITASRSFRSLSIPACVNASSNSTPPSSASYGRRWFNPVLSKPPTEIVRRWVEPDAYHSTPPQERFTVVSYNVLGDRNALKHGDLYRYVPSVYLNWDYRRAVICEELLQLSPDIICLQEVDKYYDLLNVLEKAGYAGSYKRRTGDYVDGCAMFWKADKCQLLEGESIEFKQFGLRDNVAQLSVFEMPEGSETGSRRVVIGNIHVLYNPHRGDVKLGQIRFLTSRAYILSEKWENAPVVLAGDYNSTPGSAIYKFLSSSELNILLHDRKELSGQRRNRNTVLRLRREKNTLFVLMDRFLNKCGWTDEEINVATGTNNHIIMHPLKLNSSYAAVKGSVRTRGSNNEPLATSYHSKFLGTVDYLWYSDGLVPTKVLDTVPINALVKIGSLPSKKLGSDHLPLAAEFAFIQCGREENEVIT